MFISLLTALFLPHCALASHNAHVFCFKRSTPICCRTGLYCCCHGTHTGGVCAGPFFFPNSSDLATLQEVAKGIPNLNAALRSHNLTAWEDGSSLCSWGGVTCAVNTSRVWNLTLSRLQLEGALALRKYRSKLA